MGKNDKTQEFIQREEILIAEDSSAQADELFYMLKQGDYEVKIASDGKQALTLLTDFHLALIISNILIPEMDGFKLCKCIKENKNTCNIPVILLTSLSNPTDVLQGLVCGADSFISKPYSQQYLLSQVGRVVNIQSSFRDITKVVDFEIPMAGKNLIIRANPQRIISLILSIYDVAILRNNELLQLQEKMGSMNEHLEELVVERTAELYDEVTERKRLQEEMHSLSLHDGFTGLLNRRGFMTFADQYWRLAHRVCKDFTFLYIDIDDLKQINDTFGHAQGDLVLQIIAQTMEINFRESDILARLGEDEFTVLLTECDRSAANITIAHLEENLRQSKIAQTDLESPPMSIGAAYFTQDNQTSISV